MHILNEYKVNYHNIFLSSFNKIIIDELINFKKKYDFKLGLISDNNFFRGIQFPLNMTKTFFIAVCIIIIIALIIFPLIVSYKAQKKNKDN